jgi:hypothetical protein
MVSRPTPETPAFWSHRSVTTHPYSCRLVYGESKDKLKSFERSGIVANMASYAISSSLILVIHDNMINGTNHIV